MHAFLLAVTLTMSPAEAPPKGTLCLAASAKCLPTATAAVRIDPAETSRRYVWTSDDHQTVILGEIEKDASEIELDLEDRDEETGDVTYSLNGSAARGWPSEVTVTFSASREKRWIFKTPAAAVRGTRVLRVPKGRYRLTLEAPRHVAEVRDLSVSKDVTLGAIELEPLPEIRGRVVTTEYEKLKALHGAQVLVDGAVVATTDNTGTFRFELQEPFAKTGLVVHPGFASHVVNLLPSGVAEPRATDRDLGDITLVSGATLTLTVDRPAELREKSLPVRLLRENERIYEHTEVAKGELTPGADLVSFADLPSGGYYVIIEGDAPFERIAHQVKVSDTDVAEKIAIRPYRLSGVVKFGEEVLRKSPLEISPMRGGRTWRASVTTDEKGAFDVTAWQHGRLNAFVKPSAGPGGLLLAESPDLGSDPSVWNIAFRKRLIHGRILAKEGDVALEKVELRLHTTTASSRGYTTLRPTSGEYEILAWENGTYDLMLTVPDHPVQVKTIELAEEDGSRQVDFELEKGSPVTLDVVSSTGAPLANTQVIAGVARDGHNPREIFRTDAEGKLRLRVLRGETKTLYVLPAQGSFATVRVTGTDREEETRVRVEVPPPAGTLRLKLTDGQGKPAIAAVVMRFNGEWMPYPVTGRLQKRVEPGMTDFLAVPAGTYEVWAISTRGRQGESPLPPAHAPVRIGLHGGDASGEVAVVPMP